jgi:PilZ domain
VISAAGEIRYLVLADRAAPYLLARVRWPDVAQAISASCPDWLDDPGLFDLPYDPGSVTVSFAQAASVAAGWGRQLRAEPAHDAPSLLRRMPANWSDMTPAERHAWGLEPVRRRRVSARRLSRLRSSQAKTGRVVPSARPGNGQAGSSAAERRRHVRVRVDGRAHIQSGPHTISAPLVDLSEGGVRCVLPDAPLLLAPGARLDGPFLLEAEVTTSRICLDVPGRISWNHSMRAGTHFGVMFAELDDGTTEGVQRFALAASRGRGSR